MDFVTEHILANEKVSFELNDAVYEKLYQYIMEFLMAGGQISWDMWAKLDSKTKELFILCKQNMANEERVALAVLVGNAFTPEGRASMLAPYDDGRAEAELVLLSEMANIKEERQPNKFHDPMAGQIAEYAQNKVNEEVRKIKKRL